MFTQTMLPIFVEKQKDFHLFLFVLGGPLEKIEVTKKMVCNGKCFMKIQGLLENWMTTSKTNVANFQVIDLNESNYTFKRGQLPDFYVKRSFWLGSVYTELILIILLLLSNPFKMFVVSCTKRSH